MKIFVRNLGEGVTRRELAAVIDRAARPPWYRFLQVSARMHQCDVMRLTDPSTGAQECHGFVELSGAEAHRVLKRLNRLQIRGRDIEARRWIERAGPGDRRRDDIGANLERRRGASERRRRLQIDYPDAVGMSVGGVQNQPEGH